MTQKLVLVRHGKAEKGFGKFDIDRELTDAGLAALEAAYPRTFSLLAGETPVIWTSPAIRARQTAEVVADALDIAYDEMEEHDCIYSQNDAELLAELDVCDDECVVVVGHIPMMEDLVFDLAGLQLDFSTGAVAALELTGQVLRPAKLLWFVQGPKRKA